MLWGFLWALARASLTDTYAIYMSAPLLVVLCGVAVLLGEKIDRHVWFAIFAGLAGVLVMLKPSVVGIREPRRARGTRLGARATRSSS